MSDQRKLHFHLEPDLCHAAASGKHPFIAKLASVLTSAGYDVSYVEHGAGVDSADTYVLSHMKPPPTSRGLIFRRVYEYPFWQIEASARRWDWDVAGAVFDPNIVADDEAQRFYKFWQNRLYQAAPQATSKAGFIYVPLQGRLLERRSFQSCSPIEMVKHCLRHAPARQIVATLHPNEKYSEVEIVRLKRLAQENPRLRVETGNMVSLLQHCDYVVTQNSSAAFAGYFFGKAALLFAQIDFHHIAARADIKNLEGCFREVARASPDFARYLWWFWQNQSINAGRDDVIDKITARFTRFGWPMQ